MLDCTIMGGFYFFAGKALFGVLVLASFFLVIFAFLLWHDWELKKKGWKK